MIESQLRALFTEIADREPGSPRVDTQLAHRRGRTRLRWRRACLAGTPVLAAVAAVVVALAVGLAPARPGAGPPAGPAAPRQFNPLIPYVSFGWLPPGQSLLSGSTSQAAMSLTVGPKPESPAIWGLTVYAAGQCRIAAPARNLKCSTPAFEGLTAHISGHAPPVRGHRAFWAGPYLAWQYARGGWAWLSPPILYASPRQRAAKLGASRRDAVKIANHLRYGAATPPLVFPAQLIRLPKQWQVSSVYYQPDAGVLRASRYALTVGAPDLDADGGLEYHSNLPWLTIDPATSRNSCGNSGSEIINGYRVAVTHWTGSITRQALCAADADGWLLFLAEIGPHPAITVASLFGHHLRLLGTNPAHWARKPIG